MDQLKEGIGLKRELCIICQSKIKYEKEVSSTIGKDRIREAANLRRDVVYERLNTLSSDGKNNLLHK